LTSTITRIVASPRPASSARQRSDERGGRKSTASDRNPAGSQAGLRRSPVYEITGRNEPFKGTEVSHKSVAVLVVELVVNPDRLVRANVGVNKPNTEGDRPAFMQ
jgi:hypothetical protein